MPLLPNREPTVQHLRDALALVHRAMQVGELLIADEPEVAVPVRLLGDIAARLEVLIERLGPTRELKFPRNGED